MVSEAEESFEKQLGTENLFLREVEHFLLAWPLYLTISFLNSSVMPANQISIIMSLLWVCLLPEI